jgi:hypothetical protein
VRLRARMASGAREPDLATGTRTRWRIVLFATSVASMACFEASDGDLGFHLATGREILHSGRIPATNVLSFTEPLHPWLLHQWLPAVVFEWCWQHGGLAALMALKLLVVTATWLLVYAAARALAATPLVAASCCLCAAAASAFRFELRPYLFTHLTLAVTLWALCESASDRADATASRRAQLWAAGALCAGCQLHAGALDSALILLVFAFGVALEPWRARWLGTVPLAPHGSRAAFGFVAAAVFGLGAAALVLALYHPWGARVLAFPFEMATQRYWGEHLVEFRHAWKLPLPLLLAYWAWLATVLLALTTQSRRMHLGLWLCAATYAALSLWYVRMVYAFAIVSVPLVAAAVSQRAAATTSHRPGWLRVGLRAREALFVLLCVTAPAYVYRDHAPGIGLSPGTWPMGHFAYIRSQALRGPAFLSDAWGGPFLGVFYPQQKVFFDNRLEAYSEQFARDVYQHIRYGAPGWDRLLDHYGVEFLVLRYTTPGEAGFQRGAPNLRQHLARDPRYSLVYFDDVGELFVRREGRNAAIANAQAIPGVDPDRREFLVRPALGVPALLRAAQRGNQSLTLIGMTALALADAGDLEHARGLSAVLSERAPDDAFAARVAKRVAAAGEPH